MANELTNVTPQQPQIILDTEGKFRRVVQYDQYASFTPATRTEKIELFNMLNDETHENVVPLKTAVNAQIVLQNVIFNPYQSVDEETGELRNGVTTMMFDTSGKAFATSSKSVYWTLQQAFRVFGYPHEQGYEPIQLQVFEYTPKGSRNKAMNVRIIG